MGRTIKISGLPFSVTVSKTPPKSVVVNRDYDKIFVIGFNKTGTTTLNYTLRTWGFKVGNQQIASMMVEDYVNERYDRLFRYCKTAEAFQDVPFSFPNFYKILDKEFPNSKFILSVRDNEDQWYNSFLNFHSKKVGRKPPTEEDLAKVNNIYQGFLLDVFKLVYNYPNVPLYDEKRYKENYLTHNNEVREYFKNRSKDFLEINLSKKDDFNRLCTFLNVSTAMKNFKLVNKTKK